VGGIAASAQWDIAGGSAIALAATAELTITMAVRWAQALTRRRGDHRHPGSDRRPQGTTGVRTGS